jgi:Tol biopolymer transport system component
MHTTSLFAILTIAAMISGGVRAQGTVDLQGNGESLYPPVSYDGALVAFFSASTNLVRGDDNGVGDVFVRDVAKRQTTLVSVSSDGRIGNGESTYPSISGDGRFVAFTSNASNLDSGDDNGVADIFVHDRETGTTERVSVNSSGEGADGESYTYFPSISYDGRYVVFMSKAGNLAPNDRNGDWDVFLRDREEKRTIRVSLGVNGEDGNGPSLHAVISGDGRFVAFNSRASNLVSNDRNGADDVFLYNRTTAQISKVSVGPNGNEGNGDSDRASISYDGRRVAFSSVASNLTLGDRNNAEDVFIMDLREGRREDLRENPIAVVSIATSGVQMMQLDIDRHDICCLLSLLCCVVDTILDRKSVISADGNTVVFRSDAANLVSDDFNERQDIFIRNVEAGATDRVSVSSRGGESDGTSVHHGVSFNGRFIAFSSTATNLVENDTNGVSDIFLYDRATRTTTRISVPDSTLAPQ